jgi:hypothetical protein
MKYKIIKAIGFLLFVTFTPFKANPSAEGLVHAQFQLGDTWDTAMERFLPKADASELTLDSHGVEIVNAPNRLRKNIDGWRNTIVNHQKCLNDKPPSRQDWHDAIVPPMKTLLRESHGILLKKCPFIMEREESSRNDPYKNAYFPYFHIDFLDEPHSYLNIWIPINKVIRNNHIGFILEDMVNETESFDIGRNNRGLYARDVKENAKVFIFDPMGWEHVAIFFSSTTFPKSTPPVSFHASVNFIQPIPPMIPPDPRQSIEVKCTFTRL